MWTYHNCVSWTSAETVSLLFWMGIWPWWSFLGVNQPKKLPQKMVSKGSEILIQTHKKAFFFTSGFTWWIAPISSARINEKLSILLSCWYMKLQRFLWRNMKEGNPPKLLWQNPRILGMANFPKLLIPKMVPNLVGNWYPDFLKPRWEKACNRGLSGCMEDVFVGTVHYSTCLNSFRKWFLQYYKYWDLKRSNWDQERWDSFHTSTNMLQ